MPATERTATTTPTTGTARPARGRGWTLVATSLGMGVVQLDVSVVNVAIHPIGTELGSGTAGMQWVVSAYTVAFAALILTTGALGDRIGARRVFLAGFALFSAASAGCGLAPSLGVLAAARAIQGAGAAMLASCSLSLLNHTFAAPGERARAVGLWAAGASAALSAGPLIGGVLTEALGWRSIFFINLPIGLAGTGLAARFAAETPRSASRGVDLPGQVTAVVALAALAGATIEGGSAGFTSPLVLGGYAVAVAAGLAFVTVEARRAGPMLPLRLFRSATFSAAAGIGLLVNIAFYGLIFVLSLFFQQGQHYSALATGLAFAPMTGAILAANLTSGKLARVIGVRWVIASGAVVLAAGCADLLGTRATTGYPILVVPFVAMGFGLGTLVPAMTSALLGSVDRSRSGVAAGTLNTARQTGSVLGVAAFGSLIAGGRLVPGLHVALAISVSVALAAAALTARIRPGPD